MPKIKFSYKFDEEIDRIYECFKDPQINLGIAFINFVSNLKFIKGEHFDEEKAEFTFIWKNYYNLKMMIENVKNGLNYKTYTYRSILIDRLPFQISLVFNYYWNTIEQNTLFIIDLDYQDEFFKELIKEDIKQSDIDNICKNIENYLNSIVQGLEINHGFLLNKPIEEIWKTISNLEIFFYICGKKLIPIFRDKEVNLNSILEFYDSYDKKLEPTILTQMIVDSLFITSNYIKLSLITSKRIKITSHRITFIIKKVDKRKCIFISKVKLLEPTIHKIYLAVNSFWKKIMINYYNYFESKKKNK